MATLADVNKRLETQTDILSDVKKEISSVSSSLTSFAKSFVQTQRQEDLDNFDRLEEDREKSSGAQRESAREDRIKTKGGMFGDLLPNGFSFGALAGLGAGLFKSIFNFKNLAKFALLGFANDLEKSISDQFNIESSETRVRIREAIKGTILGSFFGKKFALIGGLLGGLITQDTVNELDETGEKLKELGKAWEPELNTLKENLKNLGINLEGINFDPITFLIEQVNQGIEALTKLKTGGMDLSTVEGRNQAGSQLADVVEGAAAAAGGGYVSYKVGKRVIFGRGAEKQAAQAAPADAPLKPKVGQTLTHNGTKYTWKGAQWVTEKGNKVATTQVAEQLTKQATTKLPWWAKTLKILSTPFAVGAQALTYSANVGEGSELPEGFNPETGYAFAEQMSESKTGNSMPIAAVKSNTATLLANEADIIIQYGKMNGGTGPIIVDNSSRVQGGNTTQAIALPPTPAVDIRDPVGRD